LRRPTILEFLTNTPVIIGDKVKLRQKRMQDSINEYYWRKDDELCRLDATTPITTTLHEFIHWNAEDHGSIAGNSRILSIEDENGEHIGNCGCFNIDDIEKELEFGILIGEKDYWGRGYGADVVETLVTSLFANTYARRVYLRTLDWNTRAQKCFQKCGFVICGKLIRGDYKFLIMEVKRARELDPKTV
jgi:RimJ/RimL family protein N-acetyltransferase